MVIAVGIDIVELVRIQKVWRLHPERFLYKHFTSEEIRYCRTKAEPLSSLASRFAAKEAFQKCWPDNHGWQDVWVEMDGVKPKLHFSDIIAKKMQEQTLVAHLSLSNEKQYATAVVILEQR